MPYTVHGMQSMQSLSWKTYRIKHWFLSLKKQQEEKEEEGERKKERKTGKEGRKEGPILQ